MDHSIEVCRERKYKIDNYYKFLNKLCEEHILNDIPTFDQDALDYYLKKCCYKGTLPLLKKLLEKNANVNINIKGKTPLYIACLYENYKYIKELLKHKDISHSLNIKSENISTPLSLLCSIINNDRGLDCIRLFIKSGLVSEEEISKLRKKYEYHHTIIEVLSEWENYVLLEIKEPYGN